MKNKEILHRLDAIVPTESQKQKMLTKVLEKKTKRPFLFLFRGATLVTTLLLLFFIGEDRTSEIPISKSISRTSLSYLFVEGVCYERIERPVLESQIGEYISTIKEIGQGVIYKDKKEEKNIIVFVDGAYRMYQKCEEE